jgi:hypothetical protein
MSTRCTNLVGQRFGRLTVVARAPNSKIREARWHCRCDCGGSTVSKGRALRAGLSQSCGCRQREISSLPRRFVNLVGRKFGRLTVISCVDPDQNAKEVRLPLPQVCNGSANAAAAP